MRLGIDGIVEVLGVFTVDGHQRQAAQVEPLRGLARVDLFAVTLRFAHRLGRKFPRQVEARNGRFDGEFDGLLGIEASRDARLGIGTLPAVAGYRGDHPVAVACAAEIRRRHEAAQTHAAVRRSHERGPAMYFKRADEGLGGVFEDGLELFRSTARRARVPR